MAYKATREQRQMWRYSSCSHYAAKWEAIHGRPADNDPRLRRYSTACKNMSKADREYFRSRRYMRVYEDQHPNIDISQANLDRARTEHHYTAGVNVE